MSMYQDVSFDIFIFQGYQQKPGFGFFFHKRKGLDVIVLKIVTKLLVSIPQPVSADSGTLNYQLHFLRSLSAYSSIAFASSITFAARLGEVALKVDPF